MRTISRKDYASMFGWNVPALRALGAEFENTRNLGSASSYARLRVPDGRLFSFLDLNMAYASTDVVVSLAKMKNHVTAGVTLSMKNLFGVMPGVYYGWPKNVLHHCGIDNSIVDIAATVRPQLAIVDGVVGMEGDGPIMGTPRQSKLLVMGTNLTAVDATTARLMGFEPRRLPFLRVASGRLGPIAERHIQQRGESIAQCAQRFALEDHPHFKRFRG